MIASFAVIFVDRVAVPVCRMMLACRTQFTGVDSRFMFAV